MCVVIFLALWTIERVSSIAVHIKGVENDQICNTFTHFVSCSNFYSDTERTVQYTRATADLCVPPEYKCLMIPNLHNCECATLPTLVPTRHMDVLRICLRDMTILLPLKHRFLPISVLFIVTIFKFIFFSPSLSLSLLCSLHPLVFSVQITVFAVAVERLLRGAAFGCGFCSFFIMIATRIKFMCCPLLVPHFYKRVYRYPLMAYR